MITSETTAAHLGPLLYKDLAASGLEHLVDRGALRLHARERSTATILTKTNKSRILKGANAAQLDVML